jgi:hypothetical protein
MLNEILPARFGEVRWNAAVMLVPSDHVIPQARASELALPARVLA